MMHVVTNSSTNTETLPPAAPAPATAPLLTIAMPCFNEEGYIETCIRSVQAQEYPHDRVEILVADGRSTDRTREVLARLAEEDPRIRVIDNPDRLQSAGMNRMIEEARGEFVVRMDVHCEYGPRYLRSCVDALERSGADNVGGAQRARASSLFQRALCAALKSPLGVGGAPYRSADKEGFVDTVFLGAFRRDVFDRVGMYDPKAITNEDAELNQRLLDAGGTIYLSRDIEVHYVPRDSFRKLAIQYYKYGQGRARSLVKHRRLPTVRPMIPFFMVVGGALLLVTPPVQPLAPLAFGAYAAACAAEAIRVGREAGWSAVPLVAAIFPTLHVSHGVGLARGLLRYALEPDW